MQGDGSIQAGGGCAAHGICGGAHLSNVKQACRYMDKCCCAQGALAVYITCGYPLDDVLTAVACDSLCQLQLQIVPPPAGWTHRYRSQLAQFSCCYLSYICCCCCQVYDALEEAAQVLFRQASSAGQRYLAHRWAQHAAALVLDPVISNDQFN